MAHKDAFEGIKHQVYETIDDATYLGYLNAEEKWKGLQAISMVVSQRWIEYEVMTQTLYYMLSFARDVRRFASSIPSH